MTQQITSLEDLRGWRAQPGTVALVPTMGALHEGHLSLVALAKEHAERVIVSIFVNPTQFGPNEDFHKYPRPMAADLALLQSAGADAAWTPEVATMYPNGATATLHFDEPFLLVMDGAARPGHFDGVATVVATLFDQVQPDVAIFGEKDYQQVLLIEYLVNKLNLKLDIVRAPTQRESDGLARSSRNRYLSEQERAAAPAMHRNMQLAAVALKAGAAAEPALAAAKQGLLDAGFTSLDYLDLRDGQTLAPLKKYQPGARLFAAARMGTTRLIDNIAVE